jgi:hypothetical protein
MQTRAIARPNLEPTIAPARKPPAPIAATTAIGFVVRPVRIIAGTSRPKRHAAPSAVVTGALSLVSILVLLLRLGADEHISYRSKNEPRRGFRRPCDYPRE